jgi:predicted permease
MLALVPRSLPRADDVAVDARVLLATALVAAAGGVAFGLATAYHARRSGIAEALHDGGARSTGGGARAAGRRALVAAEIALSLVLLVGAGLLAASFVRLQRIDPGFVPTHALVADVALPIGDRFDPARDGPAWARFFTELTARVADAPGVRAAGAVSSLPLSGAVESGGFTVEGRPTPGPGQAPSAEYSVVSGDYFRAMGIKLLAGRVFDGRDRADGAPVVVVSRELARRYFPGESPLGRRIRTGFDFTPTIREIVGVVDDVRQLSLDAGAAPAAYVPETQMPYPFLSLVVRTTGDPLAALPAVRRELAAIDPTLALDHVRPLGVVLATSLARQRFSLVLIGGFAGSALALALVGLYGVIALSVGQRRREIGVRLALGAQARDVLALVLGEGARVTALGVAAGLAAAIALTRLIRSLLYGAGAADALVYAGAAAVVAAVALVATLVPASRAAGVDPTVALRAD